MILSLKALKVKQLVKARASIICLFVQMNETTTDNGVVLAYKDVQIVYFVQYNIPNASFPGLNKTARKSECTCTVKVLFLSLFLSFTKARLNILMG